MANNIIYAGIFVDETCENYSMIKNFHNISILKNKLEGYDNYKWQNEFHMTIAFHTAITSYIKEWVDSHLGNKIKLKVIGYGISDKAIALKVQPNTDVPCTNSIMHITLGVNPANGGKPVDSNYIKDWKIIQPFNIIGTVGYFTKQGITK